MSIWDQPIPAQAPTVRQTVKAGSENPTAPDVPTTGTVERVMGTQAGPLMTSAGRGVVNGVPFGETEQQRIEDLNAQYPFDPGFVAKARAATRQALGR